MSTALANAVQHHIEARATAPQRRQLIAVADQLGVDVQVSRGSGHRTYARVVAATEADAYTLARAALEGDATEVVYFTRTYTDDGVHYRMSNRETLTLDSLPTPEAPEAPALRTIDPGMHPGITERIEHNLPGDAPLDTVTRVVLAAQQARELVSSLTGHVMLNLRDEDGPVAEVALYAGDPLAYLRDARTGWAFTVGTFEDDELGDVYIQVIASGDAVR